jgi:hypothetical protein
MIGNTRSWSCKSLAADWTLAPWQVFLLVVDNRFPDSPKSQSRRENEIGVICAWIACGASTYETHMKCLGHCRLRFCMFPKSRLDLRSRIGPLDR